MNHACCFGLILLLFVLSCQSVRNLNQCCFKLCHQSIPAPPFAMTMREMSSLIWKTASTLSPATQEIKKQGKCHICKRKHGAMLQCAHTRSTCDRWMHPMCAAHAGRHLRTLSPEEAEKTPFGSMYAVTCEDHTAPCLRQLARWVLHVFLERACELCSDGWCWLCRGSGCRFLDGFRYALFSRLFGGVEASIILLLFVRLDEIFIAAGFALYLRRLTPIYRV